jgi:NDP-sugar pyrophosphorylase family protein
MKEKISITLDSNIVKKIETIAKKHNINRSKFIENILIEKLENTPVLILAGWSEIKKTPKSLLKYKNSRLIVQQLEMLKKQGLTNIYISVNSSELRDYIEKNFPQVNVIFEDKKIGSGGTLKNFAKLVNQRFIFFHCDILTDLNLNKLGDFHIQNKSNLTLALKTTQNPSKYGNARMEGNRIIDFIEKPKNSEIFLIYIGVGVAEPEVIQNLDDVGKFELQLNNIKNKIGYVYEGFWKSFESEDDF